VKNIYFYCNPRLGSQIYLLVEVVDVDDVDDVEVDEVVVVVTDVVVVVPISFTSRYSEKTLHEYSLVDEVELVVLVPK
jgi:hypothetical protein